jgi:hypothetical protein
LTATEVTPASCSGVRYGCRYLLNSGELVDSEKSAGYGAMRAVILASV